MCTRVYYVYNICVLDIICECIYYYVYRSYEFDLKASPAEDLRHSFATSLVPVNGKVKVRARVRG